MATNFPDTTSLEEGYAFFDDNTGLTYYWYDPVWKASFTQSERDDRYVNAGGDTMIGSLALNDKITLDATDGSASFAGIVETEGTRGGFISSTVPVPSADSSWTVYGGNNYAGNSTFSVKGDGSAIFAGNVEIGDFDYQSTTTTGVEINPDGLLEVQRKATDVESEQMFTLWYGTEDIAQFTANPIFKIGRPYNDILLYGGTGASTDSLADPPRIDIYGSTDTLADDVILAGYSHPIGDATRTTVFQITYDGNATFGGNVSTYGVVFDGSGGTSKTLDDYEEGTFTPTVSSQTSGTVTQLGNVSYTRRQGTYVKIGRTVYFMIDIASVIAWGSVADSSNNFSISGLPFVHDQIGPNQIGSNFASRNFLPRHWQTSWPTSQSPSNDAPVWVLGGDVAYITTQVSRNGDEDYNYSVSEWKSASSSATRTFEIQVGGTYTTEA